MIHKTIYNVRGSDVRRLQLDKPADSVRLLAARQGFPGYSDAVTLQPGERLAIIAPGAPDRWAQAVIARDLPPCAPPLDKSHTAESPWVGQEAHGGFSQPPAHPLAFNPPVAAARPLPAMDRTTRQERQARAAACIHCGAHLIRERGAWVDETGGDVCGWDGGNAPHQDISDEEPRPLPAMDPARCVLGNSGYYSGASFNED